MSLGEDEDSDKKFRTSRSWVNEDREKDADAKHISSSGRRASRVGLWELYSPNAGNKVVCLLVQNLKQ